MLYRGKVIDLIRVKRRFWAKVDKTPGHGPNGDCWVWTGSKNQEGRGLFSLGGYTVVASRIAWVLKYKKFPKPNALHSCDYPSCVRWNHLFEGNQKDNMADMIAKGRQWDRCGERNPNVKLSNHDVASIVQQYNQVRGSKYGLLNRLATQFNVKKAIIFVIVHGRHRKVA